MFAALARQSGDPILQARANKSVNGSSGGSGKRSCDDAVAASGGDDDKDPSDQNPSKQLAVGDHLMTVSELSEMIEEIGTGPYYLFFVCEDTLCVTAGASYLTVIFKLNIGPFLTKITEKIWEALMLKN